MTDAEQSGVSDRIALLSAPFGDEAGLRERERAAHYLLEHADAAYPELVLLLESGDAANSFAIIELLPRFGRESSVSVLARLLEDGDELVAPASAHALADHSQASAHHALIAALESSRSATVAAAADALARRGEPDCAALVRAMTHSDPRARYHVLQAAAALHCLSGDQLRSIAATDTDPDVQQLAASLLDARGSGATP